MRAKFDGYISNVRMAQSARTIHHSYIVEEPIVVTAGPLLKPIIESYRCRNRPTPTIASHSTTNNILMNIGDETSSLITLR